MKLLQTIIKGKNLKEELGTDELGYLEQPEQLDESENIEEMAKPRKFPRCDVEVLGNNHYTVLLNEGRYLISYGTKIAFIDNKTGVTYLSKDNWDYSKTTARFRNQFLGITTPEVRKFISDGTFKLVDL